MDYNLFNSFLMKEIIIDMVWSIYEIWGEVKPYQIESDQDLN